MPLILGGWTLLGKRARLDAVVDLAVAGGATVSAPGPIVPTTNDLSPRAPAFYTTAQGAAAAMFSATTVAGAIADREALTSLTSAEKAALVSVFLRWAMNPAAYRIAIVRVSDDAYDAQPGLRVIGMPRPALLDETARRRLCLLYLDADWQDGFGVDAVGEAQVYIR